MLDYIKDQERFVGAVSPEALKLLLMRCHPSGCGWQEDKRLADIFPDLEIYRGKKSVYHDLRQSRLCIGTYNSTTYLETFAAKFPTFLFWNPDINEVRDSARPYFDELRRVGILHDTPESAAAKVNDIYTDPMVWWASQEVLEVRDWFCLRYARASDTWVSQWTEELKNH